jgi:type VI secretion system protein ImpH
MAHAVRSAAHFLSTLRQMIARPEGLAAAKRLTRRQWRPLRQLLRRADAPAILEIIQSQTLARRQQQPQAPQPWGLDQALQALNREDVHATLFGALRLLQGAQPLKARLGYSHRAEEDPVRLDQGLLMGFAEREIDAIEPARSSHASGRPVLTQWAVGLLGPQGALPLTWTQYAHDLAHAAHRSARDNSFLAFANVLQRRQLALLYRAWSDTQAITGVDAQGDAHPLADRLRAVAGLAHASLAGRDSVAEGFKLAFAAVLSRRVKSPQPLAAMLARHFGCEVRIEEFCARWLEIPADQRTRLGTAFSQLGADAVAGAMVWDSATRFRILLGPVGLARYREFLPHGPAYRQLHDLVVLYAGPEWEWELVPLLRHDEVPYSWIGNEGLLLGWSSWLGVRYERTDADDLRLGMSPRFTAHTSPQKATAH